MWEPINLTANCPAAAQFNACSALGHVYLNLLVHLYGDSHDARVQSTLDRGISHHDRHGRWDAEYDYKRDIELENDEYDAGVKDRYVSQQRDTNKYDRHGRWETSEYHRDGDDKGTRDEYDTIVKDRHSIKQSGKMQYDRDERRYKAFDIDGDGGWDNEEYDFIVVGAGAAGCVVANRLTEHNFKVLLLEAGSEQPDVTLVPAFSAGLMGSNIIWQFQTQPDGKSCLGQPGQSCVWPTGRVMGGGSSVNSMAYIRGNKLDYDTWAAMGNEGWSYKDVLPFFKKSEKNLNLENQNGKYHGVDGAIPISRYPYIDVPSIMMTDAYNQRGLPLNDYNGEEQVGTMQGQAFSQSGLRVSTNNGYIQPIRYTRKNLNVRVESLAVKILIDDNNKAYGVEYTKDGKIYAAFAKKEVIVSAGPMNSPKLLMLSGVGPKKHLNDVGIKVVKDLHVGYNLHDHVTFDGILIVLPNATATTVSPKEMLNEVIRFKYIDLKNGPLSGNGAVNSISFLKTDPNLPAPDIQYQADMVESWREYAKQPAVYKSIPVFPTAFYDGILPRTMNLVPKSRGRLFLNKTDVYANSVIYANYFGVQEDLTTLIKGVKFLLTLEETRAFKERGAYFLKRSLPPCENYKWGTNEYIACLAVSLTTTTYHPVGTCKMGPEWDKTAVVSPRLKVYGIEGLRVIDSSIMPVVPRGNTNAPSIMVGERGVDLVLQDWLGHKYHGLR